MRSALALVITALLSVVLAAVPTEAAWAVDPSCQSAASVSPVIEDLPWAQQMYDPASKLWPFSVGAGVTVAVLDSGVDATHPQLEGKVVPGVGYLPELPTGNIDCVPHGTAVASIITARALPGVGFAGLAPGTTILPVRVSDKTFNAPGNEYLDPEILAAGIDYSVASGARVIAVSTVCYFDSPGLQAAVSRALDAGVIVVAAVGDGHDQSDGDLTPSLFPTYPAAYDGVIGVGAIDRDGVRLPTSQVGSYVDLVAPGFEVTAAGFGGHETYGGSGIAVGFVAAAAALLLGQPGSELGQLSGRDLVNTLSGRLAASADLTAGGPGNLGYGNGLVDPYRAMTESDTGSGPAELDPRQAPPPDEAGIRLAAERAAAEGSAMRDTLVLGAVALAIVAAALLLPRGRRRRWRPGRDRETQPERDDVRPEFLPGEMLFQPGASSVTARE